MTNSPQHCNATQLNSANVPGAIAVVDAPPAGVDGKDDVGRAGATVARCPLCGADSPDLGGLRRSPITGALYWNGRKINFAGTHGGIKPRAIFELLMDRAGQIVSRAELVIALSSPEKPGSQVRVNRAIDVYLSELRKTITLNSLPFAILRSQPSKHTISGYCLLPLHV